MLGHAVSNSLLLQRYSRFSIHDHVAALNRNWGTSSQAIFLTHHAHTDGIRKESKQELEIKRTDHVCRSRSVNERMTRQAWLHNLSLGLDILQRSQLFPLRRSSVLDGNNKQTLSLEVSQLIPSLLSSRFFPHLIPLSILDNCFFIAESTKDPFLNQNHQHEQDIQQKKNPL